MEEAEGVAMGSGLDGSQGFASKSERQKSYIARARAHETNCRGHASPKFWSSAHKVGSTRGIGVGLYLRLLSWLELMFLLLMLSSVAYLVTINNAVFTDVDHKDSFEFGVKVYPQAQLSSFTFGAIVSSSMDNNTLTYMNVNIANQWNGPMRKSTFLKWISYVDACTSFLLLLAMILLEHMARWFCRTVDKHCQEVSDYTVLVQGLPSNASPQEVGEHFSRFGDIVEAHLVLDMGWILNTCARVTHLQQRLQLLQDEKTYRGTEPSHQQEVEVLETKLQQSVTNINNLCSKPLPLKLAFVTYNDLASVKRCLDGCPSGCIMSWFMADAQRFLGIHRFWVAKASPPEDYLYENLSYSRLSRFARKVLTRGVVLLIFLITATIITGLSNFDASNTNSLQWKTGQLNTDTQAAISSLPQTNVSGSLTAVCSSALAGSCTSYYSTMFGSSLHLSFGSLLRWGNVTEGLLNLRPALKAMQSTWLAAGPGAAATGLNASFAACFPCFCLGLEQKPHDDDPAWRTASSVECSPYISQYNLSIWGLSAAIALVITCLNMALKYALGTLLAFEKHWTRSGLEWWYACMAFTAQFLNSAVVLVLVNSSQLKEASHVDQGGSVLLQHIMLNGQYSDFEQLWYENVGKALMIFMVINTVGPITSLLCDFALRYLQQRWTVRWSKHDVQQRYDEAFARPDFNLQGRVSDVMLSVTIGLIFGSGLPLLYLVVLGGLMIQNVVDRYCIARACQVSSRYAENLPTLVIRWLPWALLMHCCFGLWMHTYFLVDDGSDASSVVLSSGAQLVTHLGGASSSSDLYHNTMAQRVTQPNGIPMLFVAILVVAWLIWRHMFSFLRNALGRLCCLCYHKLQRCGRFEDLQLAPGYGSEVDETYEQALLSGALQGAPTYRIHHHPTYSHLFAGSALTKAVWYRATGTQAFTRLVSCGITGDFQVVPEVCTALDTSDLHLAAAAQPQQGSANLAHLVNSLSSTTLKVAGHPFRHRLSQQDTTQSRDANKQDSAQPALNLVPGAVQIQVLAEGEPLPADWWTESKGDDGGQSATATATAVPVVTGSL